MSDVARKSKGVWAKSVGAFVPKVTRPVFEKFGFPAAALVTDWTAIVGKDLASFTLPEKLTWPPMQTRFVDEDPSSVSEGTGRHGRGTQAGGGKSGATLVLRVEGPRALEIQFKSQQVMDRINTFFGYRAVTAIRIVQAPLGHKPKSPPKTQKPARPMPRTPINEIENERLRAALQKLADGVSRR